MCATKNKLPIVTLQHITCEIRIIKRSYLSFQVSARQVSWSHLKLVKMNTIFLSYL